jgi:ABC-type dipeptide/oligopeptide/nickel transport system permease subunit
LAGWVISIGLVAMAFLGPHVAPHDPRKIDVVGQLQGPSWVNPLGTDELGRDILSRILVGARWTLGIALGSVMVGLLLGGLLGLVSGYRGGWLDHLLSSAIDAMLAIPGFLLALVVVAILGVGLVSVATALALTMIPQFARLARGSALAERELDYVSAARCLGDGHLRIMLRHILPNIVPSLIVLTSLRIATAILVLSGLSFLGLGVQPPEPEWGAMIATARRFVLIRPHVILFPGLALMIAVYGFNVLGDRLRDTLDPRLRGTT